jgi:hypothetical protein
MAKTEALDEGVLEGAGAELAEQLRQPERADRRLRLIPLPDEVSAGPNGVQEPVASNKQALAIMRQIAERHKGRRLTDNSDTMRLLREVRAGAAYGYEPCE